MSKKIHVDKQGLEFFNSLSGKLEIELTEPAEQATPSMLNLVAKPDAEVKSLCFNAQVFEEQTQEWRLLTQSELETVVFVGEIIELRGDSEQVVLHKAPDCKQFRIRDLLDAVETTERISRGATEWLGGVDVHHIYFEGIHQSEDGVWEIYWGS